MNKLIKNTLKTLTVAPIALPIVIAVSCGEDEQLKKDPEDLEIHQGIADKKFVFSKGNLIDPKTKELSKSFLDDITKFHEGIEKGLEKFKGKEGKVWQKITYDFSGSKLTSFPWKVFNLFEQDRKIFEFPIKLILNNNELTSFDFKRLPRNIVKLDLSHNKLSGEAPLKDFKYKHQGIYVNLKHNNYTTYDKEYLKSLKDSDHGITVVKDDESIMNRYKLWDKNILGLIMEPRMKKYNEGKHSMSFPEIYSDKNMEISLSVAQAVFASSSKYTRVILSDNKIKW
ncbi:hypothetical protein [Mycoplasma todarodis]|uniref:Uncharacterized protein n=1 Tax=Mycoplasma todarodis TaxID=1937191 RepID=A0A4R0XT58_9MOLU|nr:hypothetical protein [Mycoplasma todarodis]TCG12083.1 hypothetical protein C4B25_00110 [Mycoplasma todarodis]